MNRLNLYITLFITMIYLMLAHFDASSALLLTGLLLFRFMSRVFEISYAFTADVLSNKNRSRLNKNERIKLAVFSYIELFFLSAPVYLILGVACDSLSAISVSLSVGTLTNIGLVVFNGASMLSNVVFVQVFATLSLVVFSLAMYLSREN